MSEVRIRINLLLSSLIQTENAVNLTDPVFRGKYQGRQKHAGSYTRRNYRCTLKLATDDFDAMLQRCKIAGVRSMIVTGGSLRESKMALATAKQSSSLGPSVVSSEIR
jgi:hypothetical protein